MNAVVLAGAGVGVGLCLVLHGIIANPRSLAMSFARLERTGVSVFSQRSSVSGLGVDGLGARLARLARLANGHLSPRIAKDLAIMERPVEQFVVEKLTTSISLVGVVVALAMTMAFAGSAMPMGLTLVLVLFGAAVGFVLPDLTLRANAKARRAGFRHALSSYLDLVNVLLAGGAGIETSLEAAAQAGDGWAYVQIRHALLRSRTMRQSPWACFTELSESIDVQELAEIAASVRLAGEQGARIKLSLSAKAAALRAHQMARIEAEAQAATERMGLPTVLMFVGFIVLLGYPAMQQIVQAL